MKEFLVLISQILVIVCIQQLSEIIIDPQARPNFIRLISIACYAGSFSLIIHYVFTYVLKDLVSVLQTLF